MAHESVVVTAKSVVEEYLSQPHHEYFNLRYLIKFVTIYFSNYSICCFYYV